MMLSGDKPTETAQKGQPYDWRPYETRGHVKTEAETGGPGARSWRRQEGPPHLQGSTFKGAQPCPRLDFGLRAPRRWEENFPH